MSEVGAREPEAGWVADAVGADLPGLRPWSLAVDAAPGPTTRALRDRLRALSDRVYGAQAVQVRRDPVPHAYRVLFRHIGLDPDVDHTPIEAAIVERLRHGGFRSRGRLEDALTIALVETGVPVWAADRARVRGALGIRLARGRLVVADDEGVVAPLFGAVREHRAVTPDTTALLLFTVQPAGVPGVHVEEALWLASESIASADDGRARR